MLAGQRFQLMMIPALFTTMSMTCRESRSLQIACLTLKFDCRFASNLHQLQLSAATICSRARAEDSCFSSSFRYNHFFPFAP